MAWILISLFLYSTLFFVKAEECVVYDFENDVNILFGNDKSLCTGMSLWSVGNYSEIDIDHLNPNSDSFISPSSTLSCGSSFDFTMSGGGEVEVNLYMESTVMTDQITVMVFQNVPDGNDAVVGALSYHPLDPNFISGWQSIKINTLTAIGTFKGYIIFLGMASENSAVLVDSFRYTPPNLSKDSCIIYNGVNSETTTENLVDSQENNVEECVTDNFEMDFDIRFTTDNYLCDGFLSWHLGNYTSIDIETPNPKSTVFMTPNEVPSCIASYVFKMAPDGIVEANIYMEQVSALDHIIVLAQKVTNKEYDTVAGFKMYYPENQTFVTGWNVLRFSLLDFTSFEGYLIFIGSAEKGSTVLVDSVRYIPPLTPPDDASCAPY